MPIVCAGQSLERENNGHKAIGIYFKSHGKYISRRNILMAGYKKWSLSSLNSQDLQAEINAVDLETAQIESSNYEQL
ncbi:MAG: hypothetical protein CG441_766 [Methylococcaceae bacterium NSM2-1]|jgi:hypothetical protein|nr:MAG: hypothetical protein CG441_766 [Methylococcaceae bacterium NSM2-1]